MKNDSPRIETRASSMRRSLATRSSAHSLNESVYSLVHELTTSWERILNRRFQRNVHFYYEENLDENEPNEQNCSCKVDCELFVRAEAMQRTHFGQLFESIFFNKNVTSFAKASFGFGFQPVFDTVGSSSWITGIDHKELPAVEAGGGGGFGFQVYCNETVIATAGFGGGGGLEHDGFQRASFGGGGGGGLQFVNSTWSRQSLGGGGGCGTCDRQETTSSIQCGFQMDADAMDVTDAAISWQHFATEVLPTCHRLEIHGGGGGGGGTGGCCDLYRVGYGFRFDLISSTMGGDDEDYAAAEDANPSQNEETQPENTSIDRRFEYDLVGWLLSLSADGCAAASTPTRITTPTNAATTANWCCQCARAQQLLRHCLSPYSPDHGQSHHRSTVTNDTVVSILIDTNPTLCPRLRDHREQVQWLATQRCCDTSNNNDHDSDTDTDSDSDDVINTPPDAQKKNQTKEPEPAFRVIGHHVFGGYELRWTQSEATTADNSSQTWMTLLNMTTIQSSSSSSSPSSSRPLIHWRERDGCRSVFVDGNDDVLALSAGAHHPFASSLTGREVMVVVVVGIFFCVVWLGYRLLWRATPRWKPYQAVGGTDDEEAGVQFQEKVDTVTAADHHVSNVVPIGYYGSVS